MRIRELYLKNFGKFSDEKIVFGEGINLFYGENESGKTTIHTFIKSMLFGMERGRGRAALNDSFSIYEPWENPNYYAGRLRFESGGKQFLLERAFDKYSKKARLICEDDGEEFSLEHGDLEVILGGLDASLYENTVAIGQMKIETNQSLAVQLQNYAANYYATGHSDIDLDGALGLLQKRKKETEQEMRRLQQMQQQERAEVEREAVYVWREMHKLEQELESVEEQIRIQEEKRDDLQQSTKGKWKIHPAGFLMMPLLLLLTFFLMRNPWNYLVTVFLAVVEGMLIWNYVKDGKRNAWEEVLTQLQEQLDKLRWKKERVQEEYKERQVLYENLQEQMKELGVMSEGFKQQERKKQALDLAAQNLITLSKDIHKELSAELNRRASEILSEITDGKYSMLLVDEKLKMHLYTGDKKIGLEQVSRGTAEQIYFALRMAAGEILFDEEYPIVLDDTFVFYDDKRLENTLRWLIKHKKQVLLFTCQMREGEILRRIT